MGTGIAWERFRRVPLGFYVKTVTPDLNIAGNQAFQNHGPTANTKVNGMLVASRTCPKEPRRCTPECQHRGGCGALDHRRYEPVCIAVVISSTTPLPPRSNAWANAVSS